MSSQSEVRPDLRYTKEHEWVREDGDELVIGITAFAVDQLGDITLVNVDVEVGDSVNAGEVFGTIESVKTLSDLFAPVSGRIAAINDALEDAPEIVNDDCWGEGWMIRIECEEPEELEQLLDAEAYQGFVAESG
jgi:glycine cleavage system H protein